MLRVSTQQSGDEVNLQGIVLGDAVDTGIVGDKALLAFAETSLGDDAEAIAQARNGVVEELGEAQMIDAAAVIANFQRMVRIADGTGIQLDAPVAALTTDIRQELGINNYGLAANTPPPSWLARSLARVLSPFPPALLRRMAK